jgi:glycosyltransferase involved in cell wall biosynthesis
LFYKTVKRELSILIPMYNGDPRPMVKELCRQAQTIKALDYEVLVIDDCSTNTALVEQCREIGQWPCCRFTTLDENIGRARIRNLLCKEAKKEWLLYLDCDMTVFEPAFLINYLLAGGDVVYGGYKIGEAPTSNLRYLYEKANEHLHTAEQRRLRPYQHFHTANFLVRRSIMAAHPFSEQFRSYGYEDVLFGKQLRQANIAITHINNPAGFFTFEDNAHFVSKTEEGLRTLHQFRRELHGYSQMLTFVEGIHIAPVRWLIRFWHWLFGSIERRNLCGKNPSLRVFKLYKLGYFMKMEGER